MVSAIELLTTLKESVILLYDDETVPPEEDRFI